MVDRNPNAGFTIIEALVALAVISFSAVALIAASETTLQRVYTLELSRAASWLADAELTKIELGSPVNQSPSTRTFGTSFAVNVKFDDLAGSKLEKITLEVYQRDASLNATSILAQQIGFRRTPSVGP